MDIHQDIKKWLRTMGYNGEIPDNLIGICNNSTKFIWEGLMQNVHPKQEVELIKRNIISNRLKIKPLHKQDEFPYKVQEIEDFRQKLALQEKLKLLKDEVQEKKHKVEKLSQSCKIKDVSIDHLKKKIKENEERKHLLELKKKQLQIQKGEAEETLTKLKNITPVEREESCTAKEITKTLEQCAEKLNKILIENQKTISQNHQKTLNFSTVTQMKKKHEQFSVATYLSLREKEDFEEISRSCVKKRKEKENIPLNMQGGSGKEGFSRRLFDVPKIIVEDSEKSFDNLPPSRHFIDHDEKISFKKPKKRESLGLLPDSCLNDRDDDSFISSIPSNNDRDNDISGYSDNVFSFMPMKSIDSSDSVVFNVNEKRQDKDKNKVKTLKAEEIVKKELYNDKYVNKKLEDVLHGNNRELIYEVLQKMIQNTKVEFTKIVSMEESMDKRKNNVNEDDITKLRFIHVQTELKIVQQKKALKDLVAKIGRRKLKLFNSLGSKDLAEFQEWLELHIKQVGLDASLAAMKKEINSTKNLEVDDNELQVLSSRILKVKNDIANKINLIQRTIDDAYKTQQFLTSTRESVLSPIWHIRMFKTETDWMNPLIENLWSAEIQVFEDFPLEYQRMCRFTNSKTYYRDLCVDNYPEDTKMEPEHLQMLSEILESPFSPPETILINILKAKMKLDVLKKIHNKLEVNKVSSGQNVKKYSFEDLKKQESYLDYSIDRLKSIMFSANASKTLATGDMIQKSMEIWTEMPFKEFISLKREVNGNNYQFYQNKLNSFL